MEQQQQQQQRCSSNVKQKQFEYEQKQQQFIINSQEIDRFYFRDDFVSVKHLVR